MRLAVQYEKRTLLGHDVHFHARVRIVEYGLVSVSTRTRDTKYPIKDCRYCRDGGTGMSKQRLQKETYGHLDFFALRSVKVFVFLSCFVIPALRFRYASLS